MAYEDFVALLPFALVAVIALGILWFQLHARRRWLEMGSNLGFTLSPERIVPQQSGMALEGSHMGRPARLFLYHTGSGKSKVPKTGVRVQLRGVGPGFSMRVTREGVASWFAKRFGGQDVTVGDHAFDRRFRIRASHPEAVKGAFLDPRLRALLLGAKLEELDVDDGWITVHQRGHHRTAQQCLDALQVVVPCAEAMERAAPRLTPSVTMATA